MTVGIVLVAHSAQLARGVAELAAQMAPGVRIRPAGGLADGGLGTDIEAVSAGLAEADTGDGALLLYDLGSAQLVAELAVESLVDPSSAVVSDAPLVEGAIAAAVAAAGGGTLTAVVDAAQQASGSAEETSAAHSGASTVETLAPSRTELELRNDVGLHARPAATLARQLTGLDAKVTLSLGEKEADAASVLSMMGLGARKGDVLTLSATGPDAAVALRKISDLVARDFAE